MDIATDESDIWQALQIVDYDANGYRITPPDAAFIRQLIERAERRVERFTGLTLVDLEDIPANLAAAIELDVSVHYFSRLNPVVPPAWDELIAPNRQWGFGGSLVEEGAGDEG